MDKTLRETHDFMNVESFSQLPFIRPAPALKEKSILRLFGKEFGGRGGDATNESESESAETTITNNAFELDNIKDDNNNAITTENGESSRRFECHYCCRNFPTSQALGGHQNAHKRERQHAKRAHLQSAMAHGGSLSDAHVYGLMNYRFSASAPTVAMANYPTWNSTGSGGTARFYGSYGHGPIHGTSSYSRHLQQPINGSPLALWRMPTQGNPSTFNHDPSLHPLPLFAGEEMMNMRTSQVGASAGSQNRYVYDSKPNVHDHVSLDLHL